MGKRLLGAAIIILAILAVFFIWQANARQIEFKTVVSGSMSPTINAGDVVAIEKTDVSALRIGDIITFGGGGTYTTHRIMNLTAEGFATKGDANEDLDMGVVKKEEVFGKVVFTIPYLGYLGAFVRTPLGFAIFILIPGLLIIISEVRKIRHETQKHKSLHTRLEFRQRNHEGNIINPQVRPHTHHTLKPEMSEKKAEEYERLRKEIEKPAP